VGRRLLQIINPQDAQEGLATKLPEALVKYLAAQVFLVMRYLHRRGITWGDPSHGNVMLAEDFTIKIIDVGDHRWNDLYALDAKLTASFFFNLMVSTSSSTGVEICGRG